MAGITRSLPTGTVTFLMTDVEGSTRHWQRDPDAMQHAERRQRAILHQAIDAHGGALPEEQGEGDSTVAAFSSAAAALAAALDAQRELAAERWSTLTPLAVRMAVHTGDARLRDERNYAGESIIRAARLRGLAAGGQVLVSRSTADSLDTIDGPTGLRRLGEVRLKDLRRPEVVFQLTHPELGDEFPALRGVETFPNNLPVQLSSFVGREADLAQVHALVEDARLLTLTGSGGCGKTRLALQVAADRLTLHADGVWYVELAPLGNGDAIPATVASAMSLHVPADQTPLEVVLAELRDRAALLVIDNCEHLIAGAADTINALLERLPAIRILATSRQPLNLPGETTWRVPSLRTPQSSPAPFDIEAVTQYDAVRLFVERAIQARPSFVVTNDNAAAVASICAALDGIPLAIELAASRVRSLPVDRIEAALIDRFRLLSGGSPVLPTRQQTLRASVEWSHEMLDDTQRRVFRRLSQFAGGFDLSAAASTASDGEVDASAVFDILTELVDRSLVLFDSDDGRYRLLETMKQFGDEQLRSAGEVDAVLDRHADHYREVVAAEAHHLTTAEQVAARARLDTDHENIRMALERWAQRADVGAFAELASELTFYWLQTGRFHEGSEWLQRAAAAASDTVGGARATWGRAYLTFYFGDYNEASELGIAAEAAGRAAGDPLTIARAIDVQADVTQLIDPLAGVDPLLRALEIAESTGDVWTISDVLQKIGFSQLFVDRADETIEWMERSRRVWEPAGNPFFAGWHYNALAWIALGDGAADAVDLADVGWRHSRESGDPQTEGFAVWQQVAARLQAGRIDEARDIATAAGADFEHRRAGGIVPLIMLTCAGACDLAAGLHESGVELALPMVEAMHEEGAVVVEVVFGEVALGGLWFTDPAAFDSLADRLADRARQLGSPRWIGRYLQMGAASRLRRGDPAAAMRLLGEAYDAWGARFGPVRSEGLRLAAWSHAQAGDGATASTLLAAAQATDALHGWTASPPARAWSEAAGGLLSLVPPTDGAAPLGLDEAIALALRGRGSRLRPSTGWLSLTPTELQVAELVAEGLTNPAIGDRLFMSRSTVKTHLAHIFTKLAIGSRAELAAVVSEHR